MSKSHDSNGELRAVFTMRFLKRAHEWVTGGVHGMLVRIALATLFMFLVFISHELMGKTGVAFVSILFIILVFVPVLYRLFGKSAEEKAAEAKKAARRIDSEATSES